MKPFILSCLILFCFIPVFSQKYGKNLHDYERKKTHYGTHLGFTYSTYNYRIKREGLLRDSIQNIQLKGAPGFGIHVPMASWGPNYTFRFRFIPSISFHETEFIYQYRNNGKLKTKTHRVLPTKLNFPLQLKLNTKRLKNFAAYALGGFSYSIDLASQQKVAPSDSDPIVRLQKHDYAYEVGGGFDFFLEYFKLGFEIKLQNGLRDVLLHDDTFYTRPLESLKPRVWWFHFTFET